MGNNMQQVLMDSNQGCCSSCLQTSRLPEERWTLLFYFFYLLTISGKSNSWVGTAALCQPTSRSQSWIILCLLPGMVLSQTTLTPAVMSTTRTENVTTLTVTPVILSSTTPGCSGFNTSTCEPCAPGSKYDNSKSVTVSSDRNPPFYSLFFCDVGSQRHLFLGSQLIPVCWIVAMWSLVKREQLILLLQWLRLQEWTVIKKKKNVSLSLPRHPVVFMLFWPWAVPISWSLPAVHQRFLSAISWTAAVFALRPWLLHKVKTHIVPTHLLLMVLATLFHWWSSCVFLRYCTVSLEVHYATPARLDPSTITLEETVAQVAHQVCLFSLRLNS